ncbi:hypothetical protein K4K58_007718 [Colletotrichum sp. SAR11_239]|nr:hypothetical protein K4K58_007718 [Colletotrichum sp. SAR11_239]
MMDTPNVASERLALSSDTNMVLFTLPPPLIHLRSHPRADKDGPADSSTAAKPSSTTNIAGSQHPDESPFLPTFDRMSENILRAAHDAGMGSRMIELTRMQQEQLRCLVIQMDKLTAASEAFAEEREKDRISEEDFLAIFAAPNAKMRSRRTKAELGDLK